MYILAKKYGKLCNRLFSAAHVLALAIEDRQTFANVAFYDYARYFEVTRQDIFCRFPAQKSRLKNSGALATVLYYVVYVVSCLVHYLSECGFGMDRLGLRTVKGSDDGGDDLVLDAHSPLLVAGSSGPDQVVFFQGWNLRAYHCLKKHGDTVREYFAPLPGYRANVEEFVQSARGGHEVLVGVVIRHGDYRTWLGGKYFYPIEVYTELMKQVEGVFGGRKVTFLICSDEGQDTAAFDAAGMSFRFRSGHMIENLYSLAECDYIVSPPSTYAMWASFYGKVPLYLINDPGQRISTTDRFEVCEG